MWWKSFAGCAALTAISFAGCQTWSPGAFPLQNMSRVPPPATGAYTLPNGYYNHSTSSLNTGTSGMTASTVANQLAPSNGNPTANFSSQGTASSSVLPAQFASLPLNSNAGSFQPPTTSVQQNSAVTTAQFTGESGQNSETDSYQAGNYDTREFQGTSNGTIADVPGVSTDPALQWRP